MIERCENCRATWDVEEPHLVFLAHLEMSRSCREYMEGWTELVAEDWGGD